MATTGMRASSELLNRARAGAQQSSLTASGRHQFGIATSPVRTDFGRVFHRRQIAARSRLDFSSPNIDGVCAWDDWLDQYAYPRSALLVVQRVVEDGHVLENPEPCWLTKVIDASPLIA